MRDFLFLVYFFLHFHLVPWPKETNLYFLFWLSANLYFV